MSVACYRTVHNMVKKTGKATAKVAYGKTLATPIDYVFDWDEYADNDEMARANDLLTLDEQRKTRNTDRKSTARQASLTVALEAAGIKKPDINNDPQLRLRNMVTILMAGENGLDEATARQVASSTLNIEWDDND
jgi:alcohol dehydrogenase class IV